MVVRHAVGVSVPLALAGSAVFLLGAGFSGVRTGVLDSSALPLSEHRLVSGSVILTDAFRRDAEGAGSRALARFLDEPVLIRVRGTPPVVPIGAVLAVRGALERTPSAARERARARHVHGGGSVGYREAPRWPGRDRGCHPHTCHDRVDAACAAGRGCAALGDGAGPGRGLAAGLAGRHADNVPEPPHGRQRLQRGVACGAGHRPRHPARVRDAWPLGVGARPDGAVRAAGGERSVHHPGRDHGRRSPSSRRWRGGPPLAPMRCSWQRCSP